ncbi:DUF1176 domain-containing protein [Amorphus orientalis]|uniref:DUF1176 domain-containing protein n=1 Tax=Amorphus orientalis TaxID=649198 RepID=A0AAE3VNM3_9HYPH|nr:DUF1176 domain-containing protein [Amorphus orientalis]MDQ0315331.1 hypothetical protein [Amorphus orientalis]
MRLGLLGAFLAGSMILPAAAADGPPIYRESGDWSGYCLSSGVCAIQTETEQGQLVVFRAPAAEAPAFACYQPVSPDGTGTWLLAVEGATIMASAGLSSPQVAWTDLLQTAPESPLAAYARHLQGNGLTPCANPLQLRSLEASLLAQGRHAQLETGDRDTSERLSLNGFKTLADWLDQRQRRAGTETAVSQRGPAEPVDGPASPVIVSTQALPDDVRSAWSEPTLSCSEIEPEAFSQSDAVAVPLGDSATLYVLPCGQPGNNAPFVAVMNDGAQAATLVEFGQPGDPSVASTTVGRLSWDGLNRALVSVWSTGADCSEITVWPYADGAFGTGETLQSPGC